MRGIRVVAVLTAVATASTMVAAPAAAAPPVGWARCAGAPTDDPVRCGAVSVPLDWTRPAAAERLDVQVARLPAADPAKRVGTLFFNPGGPGQGAVGFLTSAKVRDHFDIVGVGSLVPVPRGSR